MRGMESTSEKPSLSIVTYRRRREHEYCGREVRDWYIFLAMRETIYRADSPGAAARRPRGRSSTPLQSFEDLPDFRGPSSYPRSQSNAPPLPSRNPDKDDAVR